MDSGLYASLAQDGLIVEHEEAPLSVRATEEGALVLRPQELSFISYPYEWCFSQLKEAALLTLRIQKRALDFGLSLKDCSAYNVAYAGTRPLFIDTLSFEPYREGEPWVAYRQFCRHFLGPLALASYHDPRMMALFRVHLDGVPLDLVSRLLPWATRFRFGLLFHVHWHASLQRKDARRQERREQKPSALRQGRRKVSLTALRGMLESLESAVRRLKCPKCATEWSDYYSDNTYSDRAQGHKEELVSRYLERVKPGTVWDLGANIGRFSKLAAQHGAMTVAFDVDWRCVEQNFLECRERGIEGVLPLCLDLTNPSPGIGWAHKERGALADRGPADMVLALALIHHMAIGNNVPFRHVAGYLGQLCGHLVIEFVPKEDPQVQRLLESREDVFRDYDQGCFEREFGRQFEILSAERIADTGRTMYLMEKTHEP